LRRSEFLMQMLARHTLEDGPGRIGERRP